MDNMFEIEFDCAQLAQAFGVQPEDVHEFMTDGRRASFIIERRLKWAHEGWDLAPTEGAGYDLRAPDGGLWEVRSITRGGVYFNPSAQVGKGRYFEEAGFLAKLQNIRGYILSDITLFPSVPIYVVPVANVERWYRAGILGKNAKVSRNTFVNSLLEDIVHP
ncbi:hypothetical protein [Sphingopyxis sp.]|uniref:hypothetical protein n=1 Tax=Sphingopyxis sp. TaxID=1908224 RepID=UPI002D79F892|nr:hypothetical protein [Sphingopyxis sp.]HET6525751.1 hypothetical protein [Sphingopyxis sp.]